MIQRSKRPVALLGLAVLSSGLCSIAAARDESGVYDFIYDQHPGYRPAGRATSAARYDRHRNAFRIRTPGPGIEPFQASAPSSTAPAAEDPSPWLAAIRIDSTLHAGDIVAFPEGPKVFIGGSLGPPWTDDDFEDAATSRSISRGTRQLVFALVGRSIAERPSPLLGGKVEASGEVARPRATQWQDAPSPSHN
jgi:hypothetical protein